MSNRSDSAFAPNFYFFQANAAALSLRLRRPQEVIHTEGSACLTGIGGRAKAERQHQICLHGGTIGADSYSTEVTGDFVDRAAALELTKSDDKRVSPWGSNKLPAATSTRCSISGFQSVNFDNQARTSGPTLRIGRLDFKMEGSHSRKCDEELASQFSELAFLNVSIDGKELTVTVRRDPFDKFPTFGAFKEQFNTSASFRKEFGHMVYRSDACGPWPEEKLYDRRGFCTVTVVNKIEWKNPKSANPKIVIKGHTIKVPGYGTIYLGEMTMAPYQRRLHMVRVELGSPEGGSGGGGVGCHGQHEGP